MSYKSTTCKSSKGDFLTTYTSLAEAKQGVLFIKKEHGNELVTYKCNVCGYYHLSPADRQTPMSYKCNCKDSQGQPKALYKTLEDAKNRAAIIWKEQRTDVHPYTCPQGKGWHLTHVSKN